MDSVLSHALPHYLASYPIRLLTQKNNKKSSNGVYYYRLITIITGARARTCLLSLRY